MRALLTIFAFISVMFLIAFLFDEAEQSQKAQQQTLKQNNMKNLFESGESYVVTTDNYFYDKEGKQYKSVYGKVTVVSDEALGIKTNARATNWFLRVDGEKESLIVAGCQIHYAMKCDKPVKTKTSETWFSHEGKVILGEVPYTILILE